MTVPAAADPQALADQALDWFVRKGRGLSAAEQQALVDWLAADPAHAAAMARWQDDWQALDALPAAGIAQLRRQIAADKAAPARPAGGRLAWWPRPAVLGLSFAVVLATSVVWQQWRQAPVFEQAFATRQGQQSEVELPDGSRLRLDTATRVEVVLYRQRREVRLAEGQAVFQVQADARRPFDVLAGPVKVRVVGTRFSVRHTPQVPGFDGVRVAVEEGRVQVERREHAASGGTSDTVALQAGQQVLADTEGRLARVVPLAASGIAPWREGRISFDNLPLAQALAEFERYGPTGLRVRDDQVGQLRLTGTFDPARLANFKRALPKVLPVRLRSEGDQTEIVAAP